MLLHWRERFVPVLTSKDDREAPCPIVASLVYDEIARSWACSGSAGSHEPRTWWQMRRNRSCKRRQAGGAPGFRGGRMDEKIRSAANMLRRARKVVALTVRASPKRAALQHFATSKPDCGPTTTRKNWRRRRRSSAIRLVWRWYDMRRQKIATSLRTPDTTLWSNWRNN